MDLWSVPTLAHEWFSLVILAAAVVVIVPIFCLLTFMFIPLGQLVGWYLGERRQHRFRLFPSTSSAASPEFFCTPFFASSINRPRLGFCWPR